MLSSVFAALTSILAKAGIEGVDSNPAAAVFLHEKFALKSAAGCDLIGAGTLLMVL